MLVHLRVFVSSAANFESLVHLYDTSYGCRPAILEEWLYIFATTTTPPESYWQRWVAESDGRLVGTVSFGRDLNGARSGSFRMHLVVKPDGRSRVEGRRLNDHCLLKQEKDRGEGAPLYTTTRESHNHAIKFQETEGFQYYMRKELFLFDVESLGPTPFTSKLTQTKANTFVVKSLQELHMRLPDWKRRIYLLESELGVDVPGAGPFISWPFAEYCQRKCGGPEFNPDAIWITLQDEEWVGMTVLSLSLGEPAKAHPGLIGGRRESRQNGMATALKLETLVFANRSCKSIVQMGNQENNPMFQIYLDFGFRPIPTIEH